MPMSSDGDWLIPFERPESVEGYDCPGCGDVVAFNDREHECPALRAYVARVLGKPAWEDDN